MAIYEKAFAITTLTANAACAELLGFSTERSALLQVTISLESAPGAPSVFGIGPSSTRGTGPVLSKSVVEDIALPDDVYPTVALSWSGAPPGLPSNFWRIGDLQNSQGSAIIWEFSRGLMVPVSGSIVIWNLTAVANAGVVLVYGD